VLIFQRWEQFDYAGATVMGTVLRVISLLSLWPWMSCNPSENLLANPGYQFKSASI
jgi:hypothetical protein